MGPMEAPIMHNKRPRSEITKRHYIATDEGTVLEIVNKRYASLGN